MLAHEQILQASITLAGVFSVGGLIGEWERIEVPKILKWFALVALMFLVTSVLAVYEVTFYGVPITHLMFTTSIIVAMISLFTAVDSFTKRVKEEKITDEMTCEIAEMIIKELVEGRKVG